MVWKVEVDSEKKGSVWLDSDTGRFVILFPSGTTRWGVRIGVKDSTTYNQEVVYKNRSRAMIKVKSILESKSWKIAD
jgi:hypothetical protein